MSNQKQVLNFDELLAQTKSSNTTSKTKQSLTAFLYALLIQAKNMSIGYDAIIKAARDYMIQNRNYFTAIGENYSNYTDFALAMNTMINKHNKAPNVESKKVIQSNFDAMAKLEKRLHAAVKYALLNNDPKSTNIRRCINER